MKRCCLLVCAWILITAQGPVLAETSTEAFLAQSKTANEFYQGINREQDFTQAFQWYAKVIEFEPGEQRTRLMSALEHKSQAYEKLATMLSQGLGVRQDQQQALKLYKRGLILYQQLQIYNGYTSSTIESVNQIKSKISQLESDLDDQQGDSVGTNNHVFDLQKLTTQAEQGNVEAQNELGDYYYGENYNHRNMGEAIKWYQKAAEKNHSSAIFSLGYLYELGKEVSVDKAKGEAHFLRLGTKKMLPEIILAHLYETGRGREKNLDYALELYQKLPPEVSAADVERVRLKISQGTAVSSPGIVYDPVSKRPTQDFGERITTSIKEIIDVKDKINPYYYLVFVILVVGTYVLGFRASKKLTVKNQTVSAAKILLEVGDYEGARDMLQNHLQNNPSDESARELLQQTVRIN